MGIPSDASLGDKDLEHIVDISERHIKHAKSLYGKAETKKWKGDTFTSPSGVKTKITGKEDISDKFMERSALESGISYRIYKMEEAKYNAERGIKDESSGLKTQYSEEAIDKMLRTTYARDDRGKETKRFIRTDEGTDMEAYQRLIALGKEQDVKVKELSNWIRDKEKVNEKQYNRNIALADKAMEEAKNTPAYKITQAVTILKDVDLGEITSQQTMDLASGESPLNVYKQSLNDSYLQLSSDIYTANRKINDINSETSTAPTSPVVATAPTAAETAVAAEAVTSPVVATAPTAAETVVAAEAVTSPVVAIAPTAVEAAVAAEAVTSPVASTAPTAAETAVVTEAVISPVAVTASTAAEASTVTEASTAPALPVSVSMRDAQVQYRDYIRFQKKQEKAQAGLLKSYGGDIGLNDPRYKETREKFVDFRRKRVRRDKYREKTGESIAATAVRTDIPVGDLTNSIEKFGPELANYMIGQFGIFEREGDKTPDDVSREDLIAGIRRINEDNTITGKTVDLISSSSDERVADFVELVGKNFAANYPVEIDGGTAPPVERKEPEVEKQTMVRQVQRASVKQLLLGKVSTVVREPLAATGESPAAVVEEPPVSMKDAQVQVRDYNRFQKKQEKAQAGLLKSYGGDIGLNDPRYKETREKLVDFRRKRSRKDKYQEDETRGEKISTTMAETGIPVRDMMNLVENVDTEKVFGKIAEFKSQMKPGGDNTALVEELRGWIKKESDITSVEDAGFGRRAKADTGTGGEMLHGMAEMVQQGVIPSSEVVSGATPNVISAGVVPVGAGAGAGAEGGGVTVTMPGTNLHFHFQGMEDFSNTLTAKVGNKLEEVVYNALNSGSG